MENSLPRLDALGELGDWTPSSDAVVKLTVSPEVTRRIPARHIIGEGPAGCYSRLISLYLLLSANPSNTHIRTTYIDEDGDTITFSSDWELIEAFKQFAEPLKPLKVTCTVVRRGEGVRVTPGGVLHAEEGSNNEAAVPLQGLLESVLTMLARAVMVLQGQMNQTRMTAEAAAAGLAEEVEGSNENVTEEGNTGCATATNYATKEDAAVKEVADKLVNDVLKVVGENKCPATVAATTTTVPTTPTTATARTTASSDKKIEEKDENKPMEGFDPEFIHARHTCDGCLKAPIIGIRYHATNLPDYDLCETCHGKYDGTEISFVPEECDRDKQRQSHWKRKSNRGFFARRCPHNRSPSFVNRPIPQDMNETDALNEAIRRSLADAEDAKQNQAERAKDDVQETVMQVQPEKTQVEAPKPTEIEKIDIAEDKSPVEEQPKDEVVPSALTVTENTPDNATAAATEPALTSAKEIENHGSDPIPEEKSVSPQVEVTNLPEEKSVSPQVEVTDLLDGIKDEQDCQSTQEETTTPREVVPGISNSVVSEMTNQTNPTSVPDETETTPIIEELEEKPCVDQPLIISESPSSIDHNSDDASAASSGNEDWDIVDENQVARQIEEDQVLAQAAQMIGSLMFASDMSRSAEELTAVKEYTADLASGVSSVPSVGSSVPTITTTVDRSLMEKWQTEVEQLRELGFEDKKSVEVLELLEAANLGVGIDERVTVQQVVEYMLK